MKVRKYVYLTLFKIKLTKHSKSKLYLFTSRKGWVVGPSSPSEIYKERQTVLLRHAAKSKMLKAKSLATPSRRRATGAQD